MRVLIATAAEEGRVGDAAVTFVKHRRTSRGKCNHGDRTCIACAADDGREKGSEVAPHAYVGIGCRPPLWSRGERLAAAIDGCTVASHHCRSTSSPSSSMAVSDTVVTVFLSCGSKRQCEFVAFVLASAIAVHYLLMDASLGEENMSVLGFHGLLSGSLERFTSRSMSPSTLNHINLLGGVQEEKGVWRAAERR
ncbi:hypothetical protein GW17_00004096 [Ensete ventricosum]|nr:hypothetical protein GW17_00004096 [Ensete ventricosum]